MVLRTNVENCKKSLAKVKYICPLVVEYYLIVQWYGFVKNGDEWASIP